MRSDWRTGDPRYKVDISETRRRVTITGWKAWLLYWKPKAETIMFYDVTLLMRAGEDNKWVMQRHVSTYTVKGAKRAANRIVNDWEKSAPQFVKQRELKQSYSLLDQPRPHDQTLYFD